MRELLYLLILPVLGIILLAYYFVPDQKLWGRSLSSWVNPPGIERMWRNFWR